MGRLAFADPRGYVLEHSDLLGLSAAHLFSQMLLFLCLPLGKKTLAECLPLQHIPKTIVLIVKYTYIQKWQHVNRELIQSGRPVAPTKNKPRGYHPFFRNPLPPPPFLPVGLLSLKQTTFGIKSVCIFWSA